MGMENETMILGAALPMIITQYYCKCNADYYWSL